MIYSFTYFFFFHWIYWFFFFFANRHQLFKASQQWITSNNFSGELLQGYNSSKTQDDPFITPEVWGSKSFKNKQKAKRGEGLIFDQKWNFNCTDFDGSHKELLVFVASPRTNGLTNLVQSQVFNTKHKALEGWGGINYFIWTCSTIKCRLPFSNSSSGKSSEGQACGANTIKHKKCNEVRLLTREKENVIGHWLCGWI